MGYKPRVNDRKHKRLIGDALALAEIASGKLGELKRAAKNPTTQAHVQGIENDLLKLQVTLYEMLEIVRSQPED